MSPVHKPPSSRSATVAVNGLVLSYLAWGNPGLPALLLLHGLSANAHVWDHLARSLSDRFRITALDQRGHGDSAWSPDGAYATFDMMADLLELDEALALSPLTMVGSSMGGRNALAFAACYPDRVRRLVVVDIGPARDPEAPPTPPDPNREEAPMIFDTADAAVAWMRKTYPSRSLALCRERVRHNTRALPDGRVTWKWDPALYAPRRAAEDLWPLMPQVACPTLVVRGELSTVLTRRTARQMVETLPQCRLVEIPGVGHNVTTDRPDAFLQAVEPFLAED